MSPDAGQREEDRRWPAGLVETVRGAVTGHDAADVREKEAKARFLECLDDLARPFDEGADPMHLTGSAVVVGRRGTVLHLHKRLRRWMQPGGHIDPPEAPFDAALRESEEETGLVLRHPEDGPRLIHVDVHPAARGHTHLDLRYLLLAPDVDPAPPPDESPEARWYTWDEALAIADDALVGALETARRQPEVQAMIGRAGQGSGSGHDPGGDEDREGPVTDQEAGEAAGEVAEAPRGVFDLLLEVQDHDTAIGQLEHRKAALPEQVELDGVERRLAALEAGAAQIQVGRDELGLRQAALEELIEASRSRRTELERRMYGGQVSAARDLQAMDEEVTHLKRRISELEDHEIEIMEALEPIDGELDTIRVEREKLWVDRDRLRLAIAEAVVTIDDDLIVRAEARVTAAAAVPPDLLARYEKLRKILGGTGAARLVGGSCSGCHLSLPSMEVDRIRKAPPDEVILCDQCGRILVR